jgi:hypothetical protein
MLVSAAMAERTRATASGGSRPAPAGAQASGRRHSTARVSTTHGAHSAADGARRSELPGWFWGALGCLSVLVVGLSVVFFLGQNGVAPGPTPAAAAVAPGAVAPAAPAAATPAPEAQRPPAPGIHVEPMAQPPAAIDQVPAATEVPAAPAVKQKAGAHPIKVARSPVGGAKPATVAAAKPAAAQAAAAAPAAAPAEKKADDSDDEAPKPAKARTSSEDEADDR